MSSNQPRQTWSNRLTYILTVAGATVGFGATWRFPYLVGENGGGAYVFLFCIAMLVIGIPMILVENVIGRRKGVNALDAFGGTMNGKPVAKVLEIGRLDGLARRIWHHGLLHGTRRLGYQLHHQYHRRQFGHFQSGFRRSHQKLLYRKDLTNLD